MNPARRVWLAGLLCPGLAARAARADPADAAAVRRGRTLQFPRDHGAHPDVAIEWWYVTGWLGSGEPRYGFQITFFRSRTGFAQGLDSRFAPRQLLFAHAALTDLRDRRHLHQQRLARWSGDPAAVLAHAAELDTDLRIGDWRLQRSDAGGRSRYVAHFGRDGGAGQAFELELVLQATQAPLLQGIAGFSRKGPSEAQASHYVSEPQLQAVGRLRRGAQTESLRGRGWLDHEWSDQLLADQAVGWDWVGMNLDDGAALTAFQLRRADGSRLWAGGSFRAADGSQVNFDAAQVAFAGDQPWSSPATGAHYPLRWRLDTPAGRFTVRALLDAQELDSRAGTGTAYWEGLSELLDAQGRRLGLGYLEMTGYAGALSLGG